MVAFEWSDNWGFLLIPCVCLFGCITNLINILVLINQKMKDITFKYLLATCLIDFIYLCLGSYSFINFCAACPLNSSYFTQFYTLYISRFINSSFAIFNVFTDNFLSLIRYSTLKNKNFLQSFKYHFVIVFFLGISFLFYLPQIFLTDIVIISNQNNSIVQYKSKRNSLGLSLYGTVTPIVLTSLRIFFVVFVQSTINFMNLKEFRKRYSNKIHSQSLNISEVKSTFNIQNKRVTKTEVKVIKCKTSKLKSSRNMTLMVMLQCLLSSFGMTPYLLAYILGFILSSSSGLTLYTNITIGILFLSHGTTLFIYIAYNKLFRQVLNGYLHLKF